MVGSSVANMREETSTSARLSTLNSVDLPALVYPTMRDGAERNGIASFAAQRALLAHFLRYWLEFCPRAVANAPPISFQFFFTRAAYADATGSPASASRRRHPPLLHTESRHGCTAAGQARQEIVQLRQLHLQLAFAAPRMARKDIEDELSAGR